MIKNLLVMALLTFSCGEAFAQETRSSIVRQIVEVQGVRKMFEEQYAQQRNAIADEARQIYSQIVTSDGGKESEKSKEIFTRFMTKTLDMISVNEMTNRWI
jgi:hypothetical protein